MATLISNIASLINVRETQQLLRGKDLGQLPCINQAYVIVEGDEIAAYGPMQELSFHTGSFREHVNASGCLVLPSWCDSHSHLVFAGSREGEFVDKIKGLSYADIAARGGGILHSAELLDKTPEDELFRVSAIRLKEVMQMGTGAIEIKSGYGLTVEAEIKMLRVIQRLRRSFRIPIKATFLGAHAIPTAYREKRESYITSIIEQMLPAVAAEGLADFVDVFCEQGFFTTEETERICLAAAGYGLRPKLHVNQLSSSNGVQTGIKLGACSVDHLEVMNDKDVHDLAASPVIGTMLPTAAFFLRMAFQPARRMIDAGCAVALASDFNPGSSPSGNMNFVVSLSCIQMRMLPEEAINAATLNGAFAMGLENEVGSITVGKKANLILTKPVPGLAFLPYSFGNNLIGKVMLCGEWL